MASNRNSFEKRERDKAKRARAAAKRERRLAGPEAEEGADAAGAAAVDPESVMAQLAQLHQAFDDGNMEFDEFEERKSELLAQLTVD